jgi:DNA-binding SARP family transcriptional activator
VGHDFAWHCLLRVTARDVGPRSRPALRPRTFAPTPGAARLHAAVSVVFAIELGCLGAWILARHNRWWALIIVGAGFLLLWWCGDAGAAPERPRSFSERHAARAVLDPPEGRSVSPATDRDVLAACGRSLGEMLRATAMEAMPLAVHVGTELVEVFWDREPRHRWGPWSRPPSGWVWLAHRAELMEQSDLSALAPMVMPSLVRLGKTRRGMLAVHLEAFASIAAIGEPSAADRVIATLVSRLDPRRIEVVTAGGSGRSLLEVRALLDRRGGERAAMLAERCWGSALLARAHDADADAWPPVVVLTDDIAIFEALAPLTASEYAITTLFGAPRMVGAALELDVDGASVRVPFLNGFEVNVDDEVPRATAPVYVAPVLSVDEAAPGEDSGLVVEVQVLGPVQVTRDGCVIEMTAKSVELIAYLACHPEGVPDDRVQAALWPDRAPQPKTWRNRVWAARQALGLDASGDLVLPHFEDRLGRLSREVGTDVDVCVRAVEEADDADVPAALDRLRAALARVRGRPFEEASGYEWAFAELHVAHAERVVTDTAIRLVDLALDAGDVALAVWATEQGLRCCPASEPLTQARMRAFHAAGDLAGIEASMRDLLASLESDDPAAVLHADTLTLYESLLPARSGPRDRRRPQQGH